MDSPLQAAQHAQRDSQELFQSRFFHEHEDEDAVCTADAIIYQLRANGVLVYVPRSVSNNYISTFFFTDYPKTKQTHFDIF